MSERIFVTGASGRIGRALVRALVDAGHHVTGLTRSDASAEIVRGAGGEPLRGSLSDAAALAQGAAGADRIYHLAGGVRGKGQETADVMNREGTEAVLAAIAARPAGAPLRSFLLASTCAIYGDRSSLWVEEDFTPSPNTRYAESKVAAEQACLRAWQRDGLPLRVARIGAVYGEGFPFMMAERMKRGVGYLPGEGRNTVPVIHVDDCVRALIAISERGNDGGAYHVADRSSPTLKEFYEAVHRHNGGEPITFWSTYVPSYIQIWAARNNERLQSRLGTKPRFTPDNLKLYTNSVRMQVSRLAEELEFTWRYPSYEEGVAAVFGGGG